MGGLPQPGQMFGQYEIVRLIGRGGMGVVYAARQSGLEREVALKVLSPELAASEDYRRRFAREATALARLDSPHIITVFEAGEHDGWLFIATQLIPDGDLSTRLKDSGAFSPLEALDIIAQVADALADAHHAGILHRDIKPSNVLLGRSRQGRLIAYLCDFGIASAEGSPHTKTTGVVGTLGYMAPERHLGEPASVSSDIYAMGCLLYTLLTGKAPFAGTDFTVASAHLNGPIPQLEETSPVAMAINQVLRTAMAKRPVERYASAALFKTATKDVRAASGIVDQPARSEGGQPTARRPAQRVATQKPAAGPPAQNPARSTRRAGIVVSAAFVVVALIVAGLLVFRSALSDTENAAVSPNSPAQLVLPGSAVTASDRASCLVEASVGSVWCWGQMATGDIAWSSASPRSVYEPGSGAPDPQFEEYERRPAVSVAVGRAHRCMLTITGQVYCWGDNNHHQLGVELDPSLEPDGYTNGPDAELIKHASKVVSSGDRSCAVASPDGKAARRVYCWGQAFGASEYDNVADLARPTVIAGTLDASDVAIDGSSACAVVPQRGPVCWGGPGAVGQYSADSPQRAMTVRGAPDLESVSVGTNSACAVSYTYDLFCWGEAIWEQAGHREGSPIAAAKVESFGKVREVGVGDGYICALTIEGGVRCLGQNDYGQRGRDDERTIVAPQTVPGLVDVTALSVGDTHACAVLLDRSTWCWGSNTDLESGGTGLARHPRKIVFPGVRKKWILSPDGLGPLRVGMSSSRAAETGLLIAPDPNNVGCNVRWADSPGLGLSNVRTDFRDGDPGDLDVIVSSLSPTAPESARGVIPDTSRVSTAEGVHAGSSVADLRAAYGRRLRLKTFTHVGEGEPYSAYVLFGNGGALVFPFGILKPGVVDAVAAVKGSTLKNVDSPLGGGC